MKDESFTDPEEMMDATEDDIVSLLKRMQQQLTFLEKKVDQLLSQSQGKSLDDARSRDRQFRKGPYSRPARSFDRSERYGREDRDRGPRERESVRSHYYDRRGADKKRGTAPKKKPFFFERKDKD